MPEAKAAYAAPTSAATRDLFAIAIREDMANVYPASLGLNAIGNIIFRLPHDFTTCHTFWLVFLGNFTVAGESFNVTVRAATCDEDKDTHTETHAISVDLVADEYECYDLSTLFATVMALFNANDFIYISVTYTDTQDDQTVIGARLRYT